MKERNDTPRVFIPPPLVLLLTLLAGVAIDGRWPSTSELLSPLVVVGALLGGAGLMLIVLSLGLFRSARTRPEPWQPASVLVSGGIYNRSRNPMYLGMLVLYGGAALVFQSLPAAILLLPLFVVFDRLIIAREEAYLLRRFGPGYEEYRARVRRWI